jgi:hypothetical protein
MEIGDQKIRFCVVKPQRARYLPPGVPQCRRISVPITRSSRPPLAGNPRPVSVLTYVHMSV